GVVCVSVDLSDIDPEIFRKRVFVAPSPTTDREFRCGECGARCTLLLDGHSEAGHHYYCSRRMERTGSYRRPPVATDGGERR
ncbi:hypothetical protein ACFOUR_18520, partial [Halovivax cerinus]